VILREGINVRSLNAAATLWCSAMVGTFAVARRLVAALAAAFVGFTNFFLRPIVQLINKQPSCCGTLSWSRRSAHRRAVSSGRFKRGVRPS
jgi:uncharacterized membrane protein YhiD involved in acid resistance